jgi:hypothetical protein
VIYNITRKSSDKVTLGKLLNLKIMDDKTKTGKADDSQININESYEVQYWSEKFNVPQETLKTAVRAAGTRVDDVRDYLAENN